MAGRLADEIWARLEILKLLQFFRLFLGIKIVNIIEI